MIKYSFSMTDWQPVVQWHISVLLTMRDYIPHLAWPKTGMVWRKIQWVRPFNHDKLEDCFSMTYLRANHHDRPQICFIITDYRPVLPCQTTGLFYHVKLNAHLSWQMTIDPFFHDKLHACFTMIHGSHAYRETGKTENSKINASRSGKDRAFEKTHHKTGKMSFWGR